VSWVIVPTTWIRFTPRDIFKGVLSKEWFVIVILVRREFILINTLSVYSTGPA
jgi:hypothetical protein